MSRYSDERGPLIGRIVRDSALVFIACIAAVMTGCPVYNVWQQGLEGQAELARAVQNRQIAVQEAQAIKESATFKAQAEVERAKGVAQANQIIANGLKGHDEYLRYLWIQALEHVAASPNGSQVIYVPTEANLPILEATRMP
jgi:regulator of protease activity HflC (stomatin/prohibitin superfamily)